MPRLSLRILEDPLRKCAVIMLTGLVFVGCQPATSSNSPSQPAVGETVRPDAAAPPGDHPSHAEPSRPKVVGDRLGDASATPVTLSRQTESSPFRFAEISKKSGIDFVHLSGMTAEKHFPTANGSGVALLDYDNDGLLDVYFATATRLPVGTGPTPPNRLYKNLGKNTFKDVTESSGLGFRGFCHGIIVGDIDNDGDPDVFLCNYGPNALFLNNGNGTFTDVSKAAGINKPGWSSGGAFLDYDNDGDLDLYVSNYGEWKLPDDDKFCGEVEKKIRLYCSPRTIRTTKHFLYRNNGDRTFTDVYDTAILTIDPETRKLKPRADGHGFGVVTADLDGDGRTDIFVANDMNPNFLFLNKGDGTFEDATESSGAAFNEKGQAQSGMGVDAEDVDGDGRPELFVTNFANEPNTLFQNLGKGTFMDSTPFFGLAADTTPWVGWGTALADFDNDGWPDNFVTNGNVDDNRKLIGEAVEYEEPPLLFVNLKGKRFRLATRDAGPYFDTAHVGRGAAFGDIDNDGDIDIVVNHKDSAPALLRNDTTSPNHWVRLALQGTRGNRDAIGARVEVKVGGRTIHRLRKGGGSMQATNDPRLTIGIGASDVVDKLIVRWPSGAVSTREQLKADRAYSIVEPDDKKTASTSAAAGTPSH
ncbi:MAG: CRTAC1 family protein [Isosphaeraceae bacterium]